MHYPEPTEAHIRQFNTDGFLVVENAISESALEDLRGVARDIISQKESVARDWDWRKGEALESRTFRIVQSGVSGRFPWVQQSPFRLWATKFSSALMQQNLEFWYDQFLGKPPQCGAATPWHQDEAYWGRGLDNRGITCWMSFHDVDESNGCMHFVRGGHRRMIEHVNPAEMASDLLVCDVKADADIVACRLNAGSVTFHHSKTPHMTTANVSGNWRLTLAQHFKAVGVTSEDRDQYPWRIYVDQATNARIRAVDGVQVG